MSLSVAAKRRRWTPSVSDIQSSERIHPYPSKTLGLHDCSRNPECLTGGYRLLFRTVANHASRSYPENLGNGGKCGALRKIYDLQGNYAELSDANGRSARGRRAASLRRNIECRTRNDEWRRQAGRFVPGAYGPICLENRLLPSIFLVRYSIFSSTGGNSCFPKKTKKLTRSRCG